MTASKEYKKCVACAERILLDAQLCKHCKIDQRDPKYLPKQVTPRKSIGSAPLSKGVEVAEQSFGIVGKSFFGGQEGDPASGDSSKRAILWAILVGLVALLLVMTLWPKSQSQVSGLNSTQSQRLNGFLNSLSDGYDNELKTVATCVAIYYDELNATFLDPNARSVPMARVQDCVESRNSGMTCAEADGGTGPFCGIAGTRTGYSIASVFGAMMGLANSSQPNGSTSNNNSAGATGGGSRSVVGSDASAAGTPPNTYASEESETVNSSVGDPASETSGGTGAPRPATAEPVETAPAPKVWLPTVSNIKACSLDFYSEDCPNEESSKYVVGKENSFGKNAQELVDTLISEGICLAWPKENHVYQRPKLENACLSKHNIPFYVATGDSDIWNMIYINPTGDGYVAGDGWVIRAPYSNLDQVKKVAALLGGSAWVRGY